MYNNNMYGPQLPERAKNSSKNIELLDNGEAIPRSTKKLLVWILHNHLEHLLEDSVFLN